MAAVAAAASPRAPSGVHSTEHSGLTRSGSASSSTTIQASNENGTSNTASSSTSVPTSSHSYASDKSNGYTPSSPRKKATVVSQHEDPLQSPASLARGATAAARADKGQNHSRVLSRDTLDKFQSPFGTPVGTDRRRGAERYTNLQEYAEEESNPDETIPMSGPSSTDSEMEEKRIQENLEKWAARERQKRKELRASRLGTAPSSSSLSQSRLSKRFSLLGVGSMKARPAEQASSNTRDTISEGMDARGFMGNDTFNGFDKADTSAVSPSAGSDQGLTEKRFHTPTEQDVGQGYESPSAEQSTKGKGKERERGPSVSDPFRDPDASRNGQARPPSHARIKPRPGVPIVTPGRAPTIRHRAIERAEAAGLNGQAPAIIATDMEAGEEFGGMRRVASNPFQSPDERDEAQRSQGQQNPGTSSQEQRKSRVAPIGTTIVDGARPLSQMDKAQNRKSTSSRFNEVGLDDNRDADVWPEDEETATNHDGSSKHERAWSHSDSPYAMRDSQQYGSQQQQQQGRHEQQRDISRQPWWSEWLCGISAPRDDEGQSGRTFPE